MAAADFISFFQLLTDEELAAERARLIIQLESFFSSQTVGSKGYARDSAILKDRMAAAGQVIQERSATNATAGRRNPAIGIMRHDVDLEDQNTWHTHH